MNLSGLRKALASLPKTLNDTYTRILCNTDEGHCQYAFKILQWLAYAARPLELKEIAEVVAIDVEGTPRFDPDNRFPEPQDILTTCSSLISLEEENESLTSSSRVVVRLAHLSVKEFLSSNAVLQGDAKHYSIREINANISICTDCVAYLLNFDGLESLNDRVYDEYPLAMYAATYWIQHAQVAERDTSFNAHLILELLLTRRYGLLNWNRLRDLDRSERRSIENLGSSLYYVSMAGLSRLVQYLLEKEVNVNHSGGRYGNAFQAASMRGHYQVVKMLLEKGANFNASGGLYGYALQAASYQGCIQVIELLLEQGANVNTSGGRYGNALQATSMRGHYLVVKMLLEKGANVNASGGIYGNALQAASFEGHVQVLELLLEQDANVNASGGAYGNALQAASLQGHCLVVTILLEKGANFNASDRPFSNALQAASSGGHILVV